MRFLVIGYGTVGRATALVLKTLGHEVWAYDVRREAFENDPVGVNIGLRTDDIDAAFVCVPEWAVWEAVALVANVPRIAVRSTTPPGTVDALNAKFGLRVSHIPEFLRERSWREDALRPHKIVIGECCREHGDFYEELFKPLGAPVVRVRPIESELIKLVNNAYLATQISFWNEVHKLCQHLGVDTHRIAEAVKLDPRVSKYGADFFGVPFGGKCLPKDLATLIRTYRERGLSPRLLEAVAEVNRELGGGPWY